LKWKFFGEAPLSPHTGGTAAKHKSLILLYYQQLVATNVGSFSAFLW
jgi:hypothetical protein